MDMSDLFSGEVIAFFAIMAVAIPWVFWSARHDMMFEEKRQAAWSNMARPLGLTYERGGTLSGAFEGLPVRIFRESGGSMGHTKRNASVYVVRVEVPGKLPRDFLAAPRKWTSLSERLGVPNVFKAEEPVLDGAYIFQCGVVPAGEKLLQEPDVQQALRDLVNPESVSFVQDNHVGLAYETPGFVEDAGKVRRHLESLARAANALAKAQERLQPAA
ncbi:hypothetical protein [Archangium violaceum]|uniref:Uncharacterized protein n=1 Tax=Archangium violaceum Cb vi76 TaxID=1406225 RepID=A0A084SFS6_9BACT|nr:hypothetical protein [Archangium violaceum]KFA87311.1 hypothetical protein Q664_48600 [Archangium violaceum Cb vi76]